MRHVILGSVVLALLASNGAAVAAGSDDAASSKPASAHARTRHVAQGKHPAATLGAALADPDPIAQPYRRVPTAAPAAPPGPSWTGFHVGVGVGGAR